MTEKTEVNTKVPKFKVNDKARITMHKNIFSKDCTENWRKEIFIIDSFSKTNLWNYKTKDLNREKIIGRFYEKELWRSIFSC